MSPAGQGAIGFSVLAVLGCSAPNGSCRPLPDWLFEDRVFLDRLCDRAAPHPHAARRARHVAGDKRRRSHGCPAPCNVWWLNVGGTLEITLYGHACHLERVMRHRGVLSRRRDNRGEVSRWSSPPASGDREKNAGWLGRCRLRLVRRGPAWPFPGHPRIEAETDGPSQGPPAAGGGR